jgi:hypothetical protein
MHICDKCSKEFNDVARYEDHIEICGARSYSSSNRSNDMSMRKNSRSDLEDMYSKYAKLVGRLRAERDSLRDKVQELELKSDRENRNTKQEYKYYNDQLTELTSRLDEVEKNKNIEIADLHKKYAKKIKDMKDMSYIDTKDCETCDEYRAKIKDQTNSYSIKISQLQAQHERDILDMRNMLTKNNKTQGIVKSRKSCLKSSNTKICDLSSNDNISDSSDDARDDKSEEGDIPDDDDEKSVPISKYNRLLAQHEEIKSSVRSAISELQTTHASEIAKMTSDHELAISLRSHAPIGEVLGPKYAEMEKISKSLFTENLNLINVINGLNAKEIEHRTAIDKLTRDILESKNMYEGKLVDANAGLHYNAQKVIEVQFDMNKIIEINNKLAATLQHREKMRGNESDRISLEQDNDRLRAEISQLNISIQEKEEKVVEMESLREINEELAIHTQQKDTEITDMSDSHKTLEQANTELLAKIDGLEEANSELLEDVNKFKVLEQATEELLTKIDELEQANTSLLAKIDELQEANDELFSENEKIHALEQANTTSLVKIDELTKTIHDNTEKTTRGEQLEEANRSLAAHTQNLESALTNVTISHKTLEDKIAQLTTANTFMAQGIKELTAAKNAKDIEINKLKPHVDKLFSHEKANMTLAMGIKDKDLEIAKLKVELEKFASVKKEHADQKVYIDSLKKANDTLAQFCHK